MMSPYVYVGLERLTRRKYLRGIPETDEEAEVAMKAIIETVAKTFDIDPTTLLSKNRLGAVAVARSVCFHLIRKHTTLTLVQIGQRFSGRHYSTVMYGLDLYSDLIQTDKTFKQKVNQIKSKLHEIKKI